MSGKRGWPERRAIPAGGFRYPPDRDWYTVLAMVSIVSIP